MDKQKMLSKQERENIAEESGIYNIVVLKVRRDRHGYPDLLLEGEDNSGVLWRGWLREGSSIWDITWDALDPWPEDLK